MTETDRAKIVAHMATALVIAFETTPGFFRRLEAYRDAGLPLEDITTEMDRRAVLASISHKLRRA